MALYRISHADRLSGEITIQGSKNSVLPLIASAVLHKGITVIGNYPKISDVYDMLSILEILGCSIQTSEREIVIDSEKIKVDYIPDQFVSKIRSSVVLMGALLGRLGEVEISYPGGCNIGQRKIDIHVQIFKELGYEVVENETTVTCKGSISKNCSLNLSFRSVGATENGILCAVLSDGYKIVLNNVAREPEILFMCAALNQMGAKIYGAGTSTITIIGVSQLHDATIEVEPDRIVTGTYMAAVAAIGGKVTLKNVGNNYDSNILSIMDKFNIQLKKYDHSIVLKSTKSTKTLIDNDLIISTAPYPGFPTDMQSQMMALMSMRVKNGIIIENVFESRLKTADALNKMGANIKIISNRIAYVSGVNKLYGTHVEAMDLRGGAALVIAGMMAEGTTVIDKAEYIKRGYQSIENDLMNLSVDIEYYA